MAQGVRPRTAVGSIAGALAGSPIPAWALLLGALGAGALLVALPTACSDAAATPAPPHHTPRAVDLAALADGELIDAVLDECQRPLRGRLDRIAAVVTLPDATELRLFAELPARLRVQGEAGSFLLVGDAVQRLAADGGTPANDADAARVRRLRTLLDAALFGPLHRATGCRRTAPATWEVAQPDGGSTRLELRPDTLLPARVGDVRIVDYLRTTTTWMVRRAALDGLGECGLHFVFDDVAWAPDFFTATPSPAQPATNGLVRMPTQVGEARSETPIVVEVPATHWIVVDDPGDWAGRCARYAPLHAELLRQDQRVAGFPLFWVEDGARRMAAPFRPRPDGPAFTAPDGWTIRDLPAGRWLVVYPPGGDFAARTADGERRLRQALATTQQTPTGPIVAQPFLHLQEGVPADDKLAAPVVRLSVALR